MKIKACDGVDLAALKIQLLRTCHDVAIRSSIYQSIHHSMRDPIAELRKQILETYVEFLFLGF